MMQFHKLPGDPSSVILGVIALVLILFGCCCGVFAIASLVLGIVGLTQAQRSLLLHASDPEMYSGKSREMVSTGRIINIIAIAISGIILLLQLIYFVIVGSMAGPEFWRSLRNSRHQIETDSTYYKTQQDTSYIDTTYIKTVHIDSTSVE
ncbi:CCC motif membrane protein [Flavobacterium silvaticum]|uniref:DUF4190 domain-containing protein n=1 Tax=Flavobacterium silvaticum TaxID=1852020 RepID=A0A972JHY0_9FLAO|nr:CCC motif membrane protein [Flavobacterium silvaticum]NMH27613.1 hypothetical protein [Flavobacterium silvaticum]